MDTIDLEKEDISHTEEEIMDITGLPPSEMYGLPKYMWMNEHTDVIKRAGNIFFFEDYIGCILTGKRMVSYSSASRSMAFDIHRKCWSKQLLSADMIRTALLLAAV